MWLGDRGEVEVFVVDKLKDRGVIIDIFVEVGPHIQKWIQADKIILFFEDVYDKK